ncbi:TetR family transcriptional regulator [Rhizobium laguerreae]|uniref:TetR family transcriptional regulator n=1 Tax=Rhizobium laguerreae TaxID=1076926 RepID=UPI0028AC162A|nr:TetR family transcriptional regulator [Rhizobium laguerreae]
MNDDLNGVRRDPERTREAILQAAMGEIVAHGLGGARIDKIAERSGSNKRMIYHYFGDKEGLYVEVLDHALDKMRLAEGALRLDDCSPVEGVKVIVHFVWRYFLQNPEIISLLETENLQRARYLRASANGRLVNHQLVEKLSKLIERGRSEARFPADVSSLYVFLTIFSLCFFYLSNRYTLSTIFDKDLEDAGTLAHWEDHIVHVVLQSLC